MQPLILDFKIARLEEENPIVYSYDHDQSLNIVSIDGQNKPFIDIQSSDVELMTKTKAERERDDDSFLTELGTKTEVLRERDDRADTLLELQTKTFTIRERDDRDNLFEMMTKTRMQRERDDEHSTDNQ